MTVDWVVDFDIQRSFLTDFCIPIKCFLKFHRCSSHFRLVSIFYIQVMVPSFKYRSY